MEIKTEINFSISFYLFQKQIAILDSVYTRWCDSITKSIVLIYFIDNNLLFLFFLLDVANTILCNL